MGAVENYFREKRVGVSFNRPDDPIGRRRFVGRRFNWSA